jgi:hypothetical protein
LKVWEYIRHFLGKSGWEERPKTSGISHHPLLAGAVAGSLQIGKEEMHLLDVGKKEGLLYVRMTEIERMEVHRFQKKKINDVANWPKLRPQLRRGHTPCRTNLRLIFACICRKGFRRDPSILEV